MNNCQKIADSIGIWRSKAGMLVRHLLSGILHHEFTMYNVRCTIFGTVSDTGLFQTDFCIIGRGNFFIEVDQVRVISW
jgi:hypothetical protein